MTVRVSTNEVYGQLRGSVFRNFAKLFRSQSVLTTGSNLQKPSDNPVGATRVLSLESQQAGISRNLDTISSARAFLDSGSSSLVEISGAVTRIRELAVQGANGALSPVERAAIAQEVEGLLGTIVQSANIKTDSRFIFAGALTETRPFHLVQGADGVTRVDYHGDDESQEVEIGPGVRALINLPGSQAFAHGRRTATRFAGATGAQPGTGADSGSGRDVLSVRHSLTMLGSPPGPAGQDPVTGLRPGSQSALGDTALGNGHNLLLTTDATGGGIITLNGGPDIAFTGTETNLVVTGPGGEVLHLDVTGVVASAAAVSVAVDSRGTLSTDGGRTTVPINFAAPAQQVLDSETGAVLHVDARAISRTGDEQISYEGTYDLFETVIAIRDLLGTASTDQQALNAALNQSIAALDGAHEALTHSMSILSGRSAQLDATETRLSDLNVTLAQLKSDIQDADLSQVLIDMKKEEALYQASLMMVSRVDQLSLLNFI